MNAKICIVSISLAKGGLEKFCANLSKLLFDSNYEVHIVILNDEIDYEYKGELFNLGKLKETKDNFWKRVKRFKRLQCYFKKHDFDFIVDNRIGASVWRELYYISYIYGLKSKVIYMQHNANILKHFPTPSILSKFLIKYAYSFVGVSKIIAQKFNTKNKTSKCITIYNFIEPLKEVKCRTALPELYVLYLGRLDEEQKNISLLLKGYKLSCLPSRFKLIIMGEGSDKEFVKEQIVRCGLGKDVEVRAFSNDIYSVLSNAYFLALTSRYEGFPMVLGEALSVGTPIVAVDCESGPSEIVANRQNGLLIENHDPQLLAESMNEMISDYVLYKRCKSNTQKSIAFLQREIIVKQWSSLLK